MIDHKIIGLLAKEVLGISQILAKHQNIEQAILYGSRAMGTYQPYSDIDLTLIGQNITLSQLYRIENEIDDLLMPYKLDLSNFQTIQNPDLVEHIKRVGKIFYAQTNS